MASKILDLLTLGVAIACVLLGAATGWIISRYRREIYQAEKRRATEILLRTRTTIPNLIDEDHICAERR